MKIYVNGVEVTPENCVWAMGQVSDGANFVIQPASSVDTQEFLLTVPMKSVSTWETVLPQDILDEAESTVSHDAGLGA